MLHELEEVMLRELRIVEVTTAAMEALHGRAEIVRGLTGNYRLDAFTTRLSSYGGEIEEIEGIASLAANKPPRDWVDRDIDHARIEIAALAQEFVKSEAFAHVKGRKDGRVSMAIYISDPTRPSPVKPNFDISTSQVRKVNELVAEMERVVLEAGAGRDVALAALAELGSRLAERTPDPILPFERAEETVKLGRRRGASS
jgi:hypothetical protein